MLASWRDLCPSLGHMLLSLSFTQSRDWHETKTGLTDFSIMTHWAPRALLQLAGQELHRPLESGPGLGSLVPPVPRQVSNTGGDDDDDDESTFQELLCGPPSAYWHRSSGVIPQWILRLTQSFSSSSFLTYFSMTGAYVEDMYESWAHDPKSVHPSWDSYFRNGSYQVIYSYSKVKW